MLQSRRCIALDPSSVCLQLDTCRDVMPPSRFMQCLPGMLQRLRNSFLGGEGRRKPDIAGPSLPSLSYKGGWAACKVACRMLWIQIPTKFSDGCLLQRLVKTHPAVRSWPELVVNKDLCNYVTMRVRRVCCVGYRQARGFVG